MLLELVEMELQLAQNHVRAAKELLELSESSLPTTPQKKGGGPFSRGQVVTNTDTGYLATVLGFPGDGRVVLRSHYSNRVYTKNYRYLKG
jgi:hypothetical protein